MLAASRPYDIDAYHRSGHGVNIGYRNTPISDSYASAAYTSKRDTPVPELESKTAVTHRKRVPVACERCRKRKIKCSGDQGDGRGCDNCKSAGWDGCQFLRVRSELLQCHPAISTSRNWQTHHYHPYSRHHRNMQHLQQPQNYVHQNTLPYSTWQNGVDYSSMSSNVANVPWTRQNYVSPYSVYENESTNPYATQPPSYMLPGPDHGANAAVNYVGSLSRTQQSSLWLDQMNSASVPQQSNQLVSPVYPLTPAESTASYSLIPRPATISTERTLPTPSLHAALPSIPHIDNDTPPLSAVSHRSSHTWNTDTTSNISNASSRTSCGGSQDLSAVQQLVACEDQSAVYPYSAGATSPQINVPAAALPIAAETPKSHSLHAAANLLQSASSTNYPDSDITALRDRASRESLGTSAPSLYGYTKGMTNLCYGMLPKGAQRNSTSYNWHADPTATSARSDLLSGQQQPQQSQHASDIETFPVSRGSVTSHIASPTY